MARSAIADHYLPASERGVSQPLFSLDLLLCVQCGNCQIEDVVDPDLLFRNYIYKTSSSLGLVDHFNSTASHLYARCGLSKGDLAVDIGSNDGTLLAALRKLGATVQGVDPAREIAVAATRQEIPTVPDYFTLDLAQAIVRERGRAKLVTANNVFAHSDAIVEMTSGIAHLLADDGVFCFEVSYLVDIVQRMLFDTIYHEHLCYYTIRALDSLFARHGLELFDVERLPTKGGSIRGYVRSKAISSGRSPLIGRLLEIETAMRLHEPSGYRPYVAQIELNRQQVRSFLEELCSQGKRIAGYGASNTVTTLLFHYDIADRLTCLFDDNPVKHGTLSPGHQLDVLPSSHLYNFNIDYVVILAWNYATSIMNRHPQYVESGGVFITPLTGLQTFVK